MQIQFVKFQLKELQGKYTALWDGGTHGYFPRTLQLARRIANGVGGTVYTVVTNGLPHRVRADGVDPEATVSVFIGDLIRSNRDLQEVKTLLERYPRSLWASDRPMEADFIGSED